MPTLKAKVLAIAKDVGLSPAVYELGGAGAVLETASQLLGFVPKPGHRPSSR